jgi:hypothetical protein
VNLPGIRKFGEIGGRSTMFHLSYRMEHFGK